MQQPHVILTQKAAALARVAPEYWREFLVAFADFTEHHRDNLVKSQLPDLPVNQGRAQMLSILTDILSDSADKMNKKEK